MFKELQLCLDVRFSGSSGEGWQLPIPAKRAHSGARLGPLAWGRCPASYHWSTGQAPGVGVGGSADLTKDSDLTFQSQGLRLAPERALEDRLLNGLKERVRKRKEREESATGQH